jgi:hypothetical protein
VGEGEGGGVFWRVRACRGIPSEVYIGGSRVAGLFGTSKVAGQSGGSKVAGPKWRVNLVGSEWQVNLAGPKWRVNLAGLMWRVNLAGPFGGFVQKEKASGKFKKPREKAKQ